jgi:cysteine desulfurase/selenocysteine lyase
MVYLEYMFKLSDIKKAFPLLSNRPDLIFVDNASTTQKPQQVIDAVSDYYLNSNANVHRAVYDLGIKSDNTYDTTRQNLKQFFGKEEAIFTNGTTDGINKIARSIKSKLNRSSNIVVSEMEHHSNLVPWQELCKELSIELRVAKITTSGILDIEHLYELINENTAIVSLVHISNTLGTINNLNAIGQYLRNRNCTFIVDAAQSCAFHKEEIKNIDADAFIFGAHKMFGPSGVGVILAKKSFLKDLTPFNFGGGMVTEVDHTTSEYREDISRFEGGTPPLAQAAGLDAALSFLKELDLEECSRHVFSLANELRKGLEEMDVMCYGPRDEVTGGILSATFGSIHPHDVASFLNSKNIAVRAGHHCTQLIMKKFNINASVRFSFSIYNTTEDVRQILQATKEMKAYFA